MRNLNTEDPIYLQLARNLCDKILSDVYVAEQRIPSMRELSAMFEVNPNTVFKAYEYLEREGVIFNKRGMGYFVNQNAKELIYKVRKENFISQTLPLVFKTMAQLNLSIEQIVKIYEQNKQNI
ncbi:MAG: GntR family transcriptional regulator [Bacteroidales bacterium]|jgi:DNA-binding transcriptional regulator YhcF (GntR family)|nr:GntR family transcriptional regulator [Bacteroidales bacterium]